MRCLTFFVVVPLAIAADSPAIQRGRKLYQDNCIACHGMDGSGGRGRSLLGKLKYGRDRKVLAVIIQNGVPNTLMPASDLPARDNLLLADYVLHLNRKGKRK